MIRSRLAWWTTLPANRSQRDRLRCDCPLSWSLAQQRCFSWYAEDLLAAAIARGMSQFVPASAELPNEFCEQPIVCRRSMPCLDLLANDLAGIDFGRRHGLTG
jgi:hypothetical protein